MSVVLAGAAEGHRLGPALHGDSEPPPLG
jgi:hypothetical protein